MSLPSVASRGAWPPLIRIGSGFTLLLSVLLACGWRVAPTRMQQWQSPAFDTAMALACMALALLLLHARDRSLQRRLLAGALSVAAALTAAFAYRSGIAVDYRAMASETGLALCAAAVATLMLAIAPSRYGPPIAARELLTILTAALAVLGLVGRILDVPEYPGQMAIVTSMLLLPLALALIASSPMGPVAWVVAEDSAAGQLARRLVLGAVLVPTAYGFLRIRAEQAGIVELEHAVQLMVFATIITFVALVVWLVRRLQATDRKLQAMVAEHEVFVGVASHEMRTPLVVIRNFADVMAASWDTIPDDDRRRFTGIIGEQSRRLLRMVGDLLTVARIAAGELPVNRRELDLALVIEEALAEIDAGDVALVVEGRPKVLADPDHVRQMLGNYVDNARAHGTPPVVVVVGEQEGNAVAYVSDEGEMIPPEQVGRLFRRFSQLESGMGGSGLGLWIVQGLAHAHGGRAWYEPGEGSGRFCFSLPVRSSGTPAPSSLLYEA